MYTAVLKKLKQGRNKNLWKVIKIKHNEARIMEPIFMIGTRRSGSNLLRIMLNQLKDVASPHPPHIFERIQPLIDTYGDLEINDNFNRLVDDVCELIELNPVVWEDVNINREEILSRCVENNLSEIYAAAYSIYAEAHNATKWCCKSLMNIYYADTIEKYFDNPKYIYLYRDGRDVALSTQKVVIGEKHIYNIAKEWADTQILALNLKTKVGPDRLFFVSYEDLTSKSEETTKHLCKFLGVEYDESMLEFHKADEAKSTASSSHLWNNLTKPLMTNNSKKYQKEMPEEDIRIFESVAGNVLDELGYERYLVKKGEEIVFTQDDIIKFNEENNAKKHEFNKLLDKVDRDRRERQLALIDKIKARCPA